MGLTDERRGATALAASLRRHVPRTPGPPPVAASRPPSAPDVPVADEPPLHRIRRPADAIRLLLTLSGVAVVLVLGLIAEGTAEGVTEDVEDVGVRLPEIVLVVASAATQLVLLVLIVLLLGELLYSRRFRQFVESLAAAALGVVLGLLVGQLLDAWAPAQLLEALTVRRRGPPVAPPVDAVVVGVAALLTTAGPRGRAAVVRAGWTAMWATAAAAVLGGYVSLLAAAVTLLLGRAVGLVVRYSAGTSTDRPYGAALVAALRRSGIEPVAIRRLPTDPHLPRHYAVRATPHIPGDAPAGRSGEHAEQRDLEVTVLDQDRQGAGTLTSLWRALRLRGPLERRAVLSLRQAAEREALFSYALTAANVRTPRLLSVTEAGRTAVLLASEPIEGTPLLDLPSPAITDELLRRLWTELVRLRAAGVAHRGLTSEAVLVAADGDPVLVRLGSGEIAASDLQLRLDVAQLLSLLALATSPERAVRTGVEVLGLDELSQVVPLLQPLALPPETRRRLRVRRGLLAEVREHLLSLAPAAPVEPERLDRFGPRTVVTAIAATVAGYLLVSQVGSVDVGSVLAGADVGWMLWAGAASLLGYVGATLALTGLAPIPLPFWRTCLVQVATSFVNLVAPAGVGGAALNARYLQRRGVRPSLAVASVGLVQVASVLSTVVLLIVLSAVTGRGDGWQFLPGRATLWAVGAVLVLAALVLAVPPVRTWLARRTGPSLRQTIPRLVELLQQPERLALGIGGNLLVTAGFLVTFDACLRAFGSPLPVADLAVVFLAGMAVGSLVPTPGGLGAIEAALAAGLTTAGVDGAVAISATLLFRLITFWLRVPPGWLALTWLQRRAVL